MVDGAGLIFALFSFSANYAKIRPRKKGFTVLLGFIFIIVMIGIFMVSWLTSLLLLELKEGVLDSLLHTAYTSLGL